ncbi:hypothetical protein SKAU_G00379370 [Synaphobranchus kaupii]|uniref:Uncharacterized protein n=1 Tax=Synaphobranchus kaupii TaxID=118154 RepID=A0A9Q1EDD0_SYNKA|nr:hypothetical protein SKAU_G00379370 [Synaphobranchus kaupii]
MIKPKWQTSQRETGIKALVCEREGTDGGARPARNGADGMRKQNWLGEDGLAAAGGGWIQTGRHLRRSGRGNEKGWRDCSNQQGPSLPRHPIIDYRTPCGIACLPLCHNLRLTPKDPQCPPPRGLRQKRTAQLLSDSVSESRNYTHPRNS